MNDIAFYGLEARKNTMDILKFFRDPPLLANFPLFDCMKANYITVGSFLVVFFSHVSFVFCALSPSHQFEPNLNVINGLEAVMGLV